MSNGGVIGASNAATALAAPGVWNIQDVYNARLTGDWPVVTIQDPALIEFVMSKAVGGIQGTVFEDVNFVHPVGNTEGRFAVQSSTDTFTITTAGQPPGHLLSVDDEVFFVQATEGDLPVPIVPDTPYFIESVPTTTTFKVSETIGGAAVSLISNGTENADRKIFKRPGASDPKIDIEIFHFDSGNFSSGLTITTDQQVGEDIDADFRLTCVVVDKNLTIDTGGTLRITNNKRRFGFMIASREDVQIGPGTWTIPNFQNVPSPLTPGHRQYRRWKVLNEGPFSSRFLVAGGNGGNGGTGGFGPAGYQFRAGSGGGGGAFGGQAGNGGTGLPPGANGNGTAGGGAAGPGTVFFTGYFGAPYQGARLGGGFGGGLPGANSTMRSYAMVVGRDVTIPGPAPTVRILNAGAAGQGGTGSTGGGGGGASVYIIHSGSFTNNGTISVAGGSPNGGAGTIVTIPVAGV